MGQPLGPFDKVFLVKAEVSPRVRSKLNALTRFSLSNGPKLADSGPFDKVPLVKLTDSGPVDKENLVKMADWPI